jgi:hypothetical protein
MHNESAGLPEFVAWALMYQAEAVDQESLPPGRALAAEVARPALSSRAAALAWQRRECGSMETCVSCWQLSGARRAQSRPISPGMFRSWLMPRRRAAT